MLLRKDEFAKQLDAAVQRVFMNFATQGSLPENYGRVAVEATKRAILASGLSYYGSKYAVSKKSGLCRYSFYRKGIDKVVKQ